MQGRDVRGTASLVWTVAIWAVSVSHGAAAPCDGIDRSLSGADKTALASDVAAQLHVPSVDVLQSFRTGTWRVLYVDSHTADPAFLFYAGAPASDKYVTLWSGGAAADEEPAIRRWVSANAHGIPEQLADCFAFHVTKDRDR